MVQTVRFVFLAFLICGFCAVVTAGCDYSDDDDSQNPPAAPIPPGAAGFTGTYTTTITHNTQNLQLGAGGPVECADPEVEEHVNLVIAIVGSQINISGTGDQGSVFNINTTDVTENTMEFSYSNPDGKGTTTTDVFLLFNGDPFSSFSGSADYSFEGPGGPCVGTDNWVGVKQPGSGTDDLNGPWVLGITLDGENCEGKSPVEEIGGVPVVVEHFGDSVQFTIPTVLTVNGTYNADTNVVAFSSNYVDFVGEDSFTVNATGDLALNATQTQMSGLVTHEYTPEDAGDACTVTTVWTLTRGIGLQD